MAAEIAFLRSQCIIRKINQICYTLTKINKTMKKAHLIRTHYPDRTEGVMVLMEDSKLLYACNTIELPWKDNRRQISCIPEGAYKVTPRVSTKFGQC